MTGSLPHGNDTSLNYDRLVEHMVVKPSSKLDPKTQQKNHDTHMCGDKGGLDYDTYKTRRNNADVPRPIQEVSLFEVSYSGGSINES